MRTRMRPANFPCRNMARMIWSRRVILRCGSLLNWRGKAKVFLEFALAKSMGGSYGNITTKGQGQERVAGFLRGRKAAVSPKIGDYTVVFDSVCDDQDIEAIQKLTSRL